MAKNVDKHGAGSGAYDAGDPDAEIKRLAAEQDARDKMARETAERAERQRRDAQGQ